MKRKNIYCDWGFTNSNSEGDYGYMIVLLAVVYASCGNRLFTFSVKDIETTINWTTV